MGCAFTEELKEHNKTDSRRNRLQTVDCRKLSTKVVDMIVENVQILSEQLQKQQVNFCISILSNHPLFSGLVHDELTILCSQMVWAAAKKGDQLFTQGQAGHTFFVIEKGSVEVEIDGKFIAKLQEGQSFGQLALLFRASRAATIRCVGEQNRYFLMKPGLYKSILKQLKEIEYTRKKQIVEKIGLFHCLTNKQKYSLAQHIKEASYRSGEVIFEEGDVSNGIYIVSEGLVEVSLSGKPALLLKQLEVFGESALKSNSRRQGRAVCKEETKCLVIGKKDIERSLGSSMRNLLYYNIQKWAILRSDCFQDYNTTELNKIIMGFECIEVADKEKIMHRGLVISLEGGVNNQPEGTIFHLDNWRQRQFNVEGLVKNGHGYVGVLSFEKLSEIVGVIENRKKLMRASQKCIAERDDSFNINDFEVVKKLGQGQFGQVFLVKNVSTGGGLFAVKCLSKKAIKEEQMEQSVIEEKKILQKAIFPYIVGFVKAFHDKQNIFLLMEFLKGKEMFEVIRQMPTLNKPIARYYFGCLLLAIQYLHANNIVYRDIKPQNSVIDNHGKVYLIDMGTAKQLKNQNMFKTWTIIGTPHYMAPEVFQGKGYSFQADYWSLGILLYEFVCGRLPFGENISNDPYKLFKVIQKEKVQFPKFLTDEKVKNLITFILEKDPKMRSQMVSFDKIKKHEFFTDFNWNDLLEERIVPPYIPRDFRTGKIELLQSSGEKFLRHIYKSKKFGKVEDWNEDLGV